MAQAAGLGPVEETRAGSSPVSRTICANDEMVDMAVSKAAASDGVWVQVPLCAPNSSSRPRGTLTGHLFQTAAGQFQFTGARTG